MPIYEYKCAECNEQFEVMQKITDDPLTECTSCGGELKKLITSTSFVLKGGGWYVTDYPNADRKKAIDGKKPVACAKDSKSAKKNPLKLESK
jgi:putative FmdB family regulatory protein